jgi:hypothetical protein
VGKSEGERPLETTAHQVEGNIKIDLQERGCGSVYWFDVARDGNKRRVVVNTVMNLRLPQNADNYWTRLGTVSFSRRTLLYGVKELAPKLNC